MKIMHVLTAAVFAALVVPAAAASLSTRDATYLKSAIQIQDGRYAMAAYEAQHGSGQAKKLASGIAAQASNDSRMLRAVAKRYGITPNKGLLIQDQYHYGQIAGLNGSALDKAFTRELRISDEINQDTEKQELAHGQDSMLKAYAKRRYAAVQKEMATLKGLK